MTTVITGEGIRIYQALAIAKGLQLYVSLGVRPNRAWTPTAMLRTAGRITGHTYKRREYRRAIEHLELWIELNSAQEAPK